MIPVIDMHCDTIAMIAENALENKKISLRENDRHIDLLRMKQAGYMCQCFALFTFLPYCKKNNIAPFDWAMMLSDTFDREISGNSDLIRQVVSGSEIEENYRQGYMSALKTVEEGGVFEGKVENLEKLYKKGVRKATLTWNFENELAFPNRTISDENGKKTVPDFMNGLKPAGIEMIKAMEEMGVLIDVSHLNDAGISDIFKTVKTSTPVLASHSNARSLCSHPRNLTDENLRKIAEHGGVSGINFCASFLNDETAESGDSRIIDMIRHMQYMKKVGGIDIVSLGTDFDGIGSRVEITECSKMQRLADAMTLNGFSDEEVEKVFYKNTLRVYKEVLG